MKTWELIEKLQQQPRSGTPYVQVTDPVTGLPMLWPVTGIATAESSEYGTAIVIEIED